MNMNELRIIECEKLEMLRALINSRKWYFKEKQGDKNYHQDIINEYEMLENVVCAALNPILKDVINEFMNKE